MFHEIAQAIDVPSTKIEENVFMRLFIGRAKNGYQPNQLAASLANHLPQLKYQRSCQSPV
jgi:hypothetical protein